MPTAPASDNGRLRHVAEAHGRGRPPPEGVHVDYALEAVRQLRHEAFDRQVARAAHGLVSAYGMVSYGHGLSASSLIVGRMS